MFRSRRNAGDSSSEYLLAAKKVIFGERGALLVLFVCAILEVHCFFVWLGGQAKKGIIGQINLAFVGRVDHFLHLSMDLVEVVP